MCSCGFLETAAHVLCFCERTRMGRPVLLYVYSKERRRYLEQTVRQVWPKSKCGNGLSVSLVSPLDPQVQFVLLKPDCRPVRSQTCHKM